MKMDSNRLTRKIYTWSQSLADESFKNWAWKMEKLLEAINDFGGLLSTDELWNALAQQELIQWKEGVTTIPQGSETGGHFRGYQVISIC